MSTHPSKQMANIRKDIDKIERTVGVNKTPKKGIEFMQKLYELIDPLMPDIDVFIDAADTRLKLKWDGNQDKIMNQGIIDYMTEAGRRVQGDPVLREKCQVLSDKYDIPLSRYLFGYKDK